MLPRTHRITTSAGFTKTTRSGVRSRRRNLVLYALHTSEAEPTTVGFIVSKAVGNAVTRNLVKRRLREIAACTVQGRPRGLSIVVRALPAAADANWQGLCRDYERALAAALERLQRGPSKIGTEKGNMA